MDIPKKYCHNCGKPTSVAAKFCASCGTSLASIDEKPPGIVIPQRQRPAQASFTPMVVGEDDDDEGSVIRADRVNSISELGISLSSLDVDFRVQQPIKETVAGLVEQGKTMPQGYKEPARTVGAINQQEAIAQFQKEAGALRPNERTF